MLGNSLTTMAEYWHVIEKYSIGEGKKNKKMSTDYLYLKSSCLSVAASLAKPVEQMKLGINQLFKTTRKRLEPINQVKIHHPDA